MRECSVGGRNGAIIHLDVQPMMNLRKNFVKVSPGLSQFHKYFWIPTICCVFCCWGTFKKLGMAVNLVECREVGKEGRQISVRVTRDTESCKNEGRVNSAEGSTMDQEKRDCKVSEWGF